MKQFRLFLKTVVFAAVALSMSLQANISPLAFNRIFECFNPGYEMYAPNLGCAALQTGFVHALRFYTTIPGGYDAAGRRLWINDKAFKNDSVAALTILLFPSPAGNLTAMTDHSENIGQSLTVTDIAQLLNFCKNVRQLQKSVKENNVIFKPNSLVQKYRAKKRNNDSITQTFYGQKRQNLSDYLSLFDKYSSHNYFSEFMKKFVFEKPKQQCNQLILLICKIIEKEEQEHEKFYPCYKAEQLLNSFFCLKFGKNDIPELLQNLDSSIVNHEEILESDLINKTDIERIEKKNVDSMTLDDLWAIQNRDLIDQVIPYPRGCKPVNNGLASGYDRTKNELILTKKFPDCTETTIRHLCNLVLFHKNGSFNLKNTINQISNSPIKNLFNNLKEFYELQSPSKANSGERSIRDAWCKVITDLGNPVRYCKKSAITNIHNDTEVDSGIINILRVLNIIFNLELDPEPVYENDKKFAEDVKTWVRNGLETLFKKVSPDKNANIKIKKLRAFQADASSEYDCSGKINITVNQDFKFTISVDSNHAQFDAIEILLPQEEFINKDLLNQVTTKFQNNFSMNTSESIFFLNNKTKDLIRTPAYKLFKKRLNDSIDIIQSLEILLKMSKDNEIPLTRSAKILNNLLHNFLWQDQEICKKIQPILIEWTRFAHQINNQVIKNTLQNRVKSVQYDVFCQYFNNNADDLLDFFNQATIIFFLCQNNLSMLSLTRTHPSIKIIELPKSKITELELSSYTCPNLEIIDLHNTNQLKSLKLSGTFQNLKTIDLSETAVEKLEISESICPQLKYLKLSETQKLKSLKLSGCLQNLKSINLSEAAISKLEISADTCPNLKILDLRNTIQLKDLKLYKTFQNLKFIDVSGAKIAELEISNDIFPILENIYLSDTKELKKLQILGILQNLKSINLIASGISKLEISGNTCPNLQKIHLKNTSQLKKLKLHGIFQNLKTITLKFSAIANLEIFDDTCPNLNSTDERIKIIMRKKK